MSPTVRASDVAVTAVVGGDAPDVLVTAKGSGALAAGSFFEFATRFAIAFLLARSLGAGGYGLYVLAVSAATLFSGVSLLGLDDAMTRYVAIASGRRDDAAVRGTIQIGLVTSAATGALLGAALYLGAQPVATGLFDEPQLARLLQLVAIAVPFLSVSNVLAGTARGLHRMDIAALAENVVQSVVRLGLLTVVFLLTGLSTTTAVVVFGISDIAATITMVVLLRRRFPLAAGGRPVRRDTKAVFRFALPLWFSGMLRQFRRNIEALLLGATGSAANVGIFAVVNKINLVGHVWLLSILMAVKPTMAQLHDRGDRDELARVYTATTRWSLSLALPCVITMVLYREPILAAFGTSFPAGSTALVILAMAELANAGTGTCGSMIDMTGHTRLKVANAVLWTALLVAGGVVLIPRWGVVGAATASLIAIAMVNVLAVAEVWVLEHVLPYDRAFWKPLVAGGAACATGLALDWLMPVGADLVPAILQGVVVVAVFAGLLRSFGLAPEDRLVLDRIRSRFARRRRHVQHVRRALPDRVAAPGPVYIGGLDRSGKTTLAAFLTSHPNIDIPDAGSNLWTYFYRRFGDLARPANLERCLDAMLRYRHVAILELDPDRIRREFNAGPRTYARLFSMVHAHHAERAGKARWGTQTGLIERYADEVFASYPGVRIIHMIRDPRDRYEGSRALWPGGRGQVGAATARWIYSTRLARRHVRRHPGAYLVVRFEDLVLRTEETLRGVCDFLGETFDSDMLAMSAAPGRRARLASRLPAPATAAPATAASAIAASATASTAVTTTVVGVLPAAPVMAAPPVPQPPLAGAFVGRFRERVPVADVAFIQLHAGQLMRAYGYLPVPLGWGTRERVRFIIRTWPGQATRMLAWRGREAVQQCFPARAGRSPDPRLVAASAQEQPR